MQSGTAKSQRWLLEFEPEASSDIDPLMGWTGSADMRKQIKIWFETKEEAVAYATRKGLVYRLDEPKSSVKKAMSYSDNFKFTRIGSWTH